MGAERIPVEVHAALSLMQQRNESQVSVEDIAREVGVSRRRLQRRFVRHVGKTRLAFANPLRPERERALAQHSNLAFAEIAHVAGFASLAPSFRSHLGTFDQPPTAGRSTAV